MKKTTLFTLLILSLAFVANAQDYKKFKVGLGAGYAIPGGEGAKGGLLFTIEPAYRVSDELAIGLRMEWAVMVRGSADAISGGNFDAAAVGSYTLNGQYYLSNATFRPFVGAGFGLYNLAAVKFDNGDAPDGLTQAETKFGFYPRLGFDVGHFTVAMEYNIVPATETAAGAEFKNSYFGIRIGGFFGGGRK